MTRGRLLQAGGSPVGGSTSPGGRSGGSASPRRNRTRLRVDRPEPVQLFQEDAEKRRQLGLALLNLKEDSDYYANIKRVAQHKLQDVGRKIANLDSHFEDEETRFASQKRTPHLARVSKVFNFLLDFLHVKQRKLACDLFEHDEWRSLLENTGVLSKLRRVDFFCFLDEFEARCPAEAAVICEVLLDQRGDYYRPRRFGGVGV